jgi:hypothetical protein
MSRWYGALFAIERVRKFCGLRLSGAIKLRSELSDDAIGAWHPQRTCTPRVEGERRYAGDIEVDAGLYAVLVASSGRRTVRETAESCRLSQETFLNLAVELERRMALGFCKF